MIALLRIALAAAALVALAGCATPFGDGGDAAPIEDHAQTSPSTAAPATPPSARSPRVAAAPPVPAVARTPPRGATVPAPQRSFAPQMQALPPLPAQQPGPSAQAPQDLAAIDRSLQSPSAAPADNLPVPTPDIAPAAPAVPTPAEPPPQFSPPVQSLVNAARQSAREGNWDRAQAALERAVKLAPGKSLLWQQLAYTHLHGGQLDRAREVAQRALTLAAADGRENVSAWKLIAEIEQARGDTTAAAAARANVARLMP